LDEVNFLSSKRKIKFRTTDGELVYKTDSGKIDAGAVILEVLNADATTSKYENVDSGTSLYLDGDDTQEPFASIDFASGTITLSASLTPPVQGEDNMTLTFGCAVVGYAERITQCTVGALFGVYGNNNRFFVSGNSEFPNVCFHSEESDFTYFPDINTAVAGSTESAIMAFSFPSDGILAMHKEYIGQESTIYYRSGDLQDVYADEYDIDGNYLGQSVIGQRAVFPIKAGALGEGAICKRANANLGGDSLFLSANGVYGVTIASNSAIDDRYAKIRSTLVNGSLTHHDLSKACAIVYKGCYYLSVAGVCYIADSRFRTTTGDETNTEYEWWYWDNVRATAWAAIADKLYFGTDEGRICLFDSDFVDTRYEHTEVGAVTFIDERFYADLALLEGLKTASGIVFQDSLIVGSDDDVTDYLGIEVSIDDIQTDGQEVSFTLKYHGSPLVITEFTTGATAKLVFRDNVKAEWYSPALDFGTTEFAKTLLGITVSPESSVSGEVEFGYTTKNFEKLIRVQGVELWSFEDMDFISFSFEMSSFSFGYSVRVRENNFNFIMFHFGSDNDRDCAVNNFTATYKINRLNRGVV
jgi:hypothetical protein